MLLTKQVTINLHYREAPVVLDVMQGDSGRGLEVHFMAGEQTWEIPADADLVMQYQCQDGSGGVFDTLSDGAPAYTLADNVATIQLPPQICATAGCTKLQITLLSGGVQISTFHMEIRVAPQVNAKTAAGDYTNLAQWWEHMDHSDKIEWQEQLENRIAAVTPEEIGALSAKAWEGKLVSFIGDSQTERNACKTKTYVDWLKEILGIEAIEAAGSGYTIAQNTTADGQGNRPRGNMLTSCAYFAFHANDLVVVMGGINDVWFSTPMGEMGSTDKTTFYGAMDYTCRMLLDKCSEGSILFVTPTEQDYLGCQHTAGLTATDFAKAMKEVCGKYGIPVFDANAISGIYPKNLANARLYTTDYLHLNDAGHERLGKLLAAYIRNHCYASDTKPVRFPGVGCEGRYNRGHLVTVSQSQSFVCIRLPEVTEVTVDLTRYTSPAISDAGQPIGWFAFKQTDGTFKGVSIYDATSSPYSDGIDRLTGEKWDFAADVKTYTNRETALWEAPSEKPSAVRVTLENGIGKIYFDDTEVYSTPCVELGYITSMSKGLELSYVTIL